LELGGQGWEAQEKEDFIPRNWGGLKGPSLPGIERKAILPTSR